MDFPKIKLEPEEWIKVEESKIEKGLMKYEKIELKVENYGNETVGGSVELKLSEEDNITDHELTDTYQLQSHEECMYQHRGELKTINDKTEIVLKIKDESLVEIKSLKYEYINTDGKIRYEGVKIDQENFSDKVIDKCQTNFPEMKSKLADVIASKIEDELFKKDCKTIAHKLIDVDRKVTNCDSGNIEKVISTIQRETLEDNWNNAHVFNMHRCDHCDYSTARKSTLKNHVKNLHLQIKNFTCGHCGYQTNKKFHLKLHIESIHLGIKNHNCSLCDYKTNNKRNLKQHIEYVHLSIKNYKCKNCDYQTNLKEALEHHMNGTHLQLRSYKCSQCHHQSPSNEDLEKHVNSIHLGLKIHKCSQCDYQATFKSTLVRHINNVHLKNKK